MNKRLSFMVFSGTVDKLEDFGPLLMQKMQVKKVSFWQNHLVYLRKGHDHA